MLDLFAKLIRLNINVFQKPSLHKLLIHQWIIFVEDSSVVSVHTIIILLILF